MDSEVARWFASEAQPHAPALRSYLLSNYPSLPDVEDLVQDSLFRLLRAYEKGPIGSPRGLLFAIGRNLALDAVRRQQVVIFEPLPDSTDSLVYKDATNVVEAVTKQQEFALLTQAIQSLPDRCRQVMTLRTAFGLSQREIAERLRISENTVEKQLSNGLRRCAEFFARHGLP
jgi:RNA polymerase sigma factor (sigma-70 family)